MKHRLSAAVLLAATLAGTGLSCSGPEETIQVTGSRVIEAPAAETAAAAPGSTLERMGFRPRTATPAPAPGYQWQAPASWTAQPASEFRMANFTLGPDGAAECYLSVLPGDAGGTAANINRWRNQMSLGPLSAEELDALPSIDMLGQPALFVEAAGEYTGMRGEESKGGYQMLAALLQTPTEMVFTKMVGPQDVVSAERENFVAFCASITRSSAPATAAAELPPGHPPIDDNTMAQLSAQPGPSGFRWEVPEGWVTTAPRPMRLVTVTPSPDSGAECYVTLLAGTGGGIAPNLNRWRDQLGLAPLSEAEIAALPTITVLGQQAPLLRDRGAFQGMTGPVQEDTMLFGTAVLLQDQAVFVKMTGPAGEIEAELDAFIAFCESLEVE